MKEDLYFWLLVGVLLEILGDTVVADDTDLEIESTNTFSSLRFKKES